MAAHKTHKIVFIWYGLLVFFLSYTCLNKNEPVPPVADFLYFVVPMTAIPVSFFIAVAGVIDSIRKKAWLYLTIHVLSIAIIFILLKLIAN